MNLVINCMQCFQEFGKTIQNTYAFTDFIESDYSKELYEIISEITND